MKARYEGYCRKCIDITESWGLEPQCEECNIYVEVISTHATLFGGKAIIRVGNTLEQVSLSDLEVMRDEVPSSVQK